MANKENKTNKPFYKKWWVWVIALIVIGAIGSGGDEETDTANEPDTEVEATADTTEAVQEDEEVEEPEEVEEEPEDTAYDNPFEAAANEIFGDRLDAFRHNEDEKYVSVDAQMRVGWDESSTRDDFYRRVVEFTELVESEDFSELYISGYVDMQDEYGNTENKSVIEVSLLKETVNKINFENFIAENIGDVADTVYLHPAFQ